MTDFGPLIARPSSLLLGAGAQFGVYFAFIVALLLGFTPQEAASIGIIGGADGPTSIFLTTKLAPRAPCANRGGGVFLHGSGTADSAADYETDDDQKRT